MLTARSTPDKINACKWFFHHLRENDDNGRSLRTIGLFQKTTTKKNLLISNKIYQTNNCNCHADSQILVHEGMQTDEKKKSKGTMTKINNNQYRSKQTGPYMVHVVNMTPPSRPQQDQVYQT